MRFFKFIILGFLLGSSLTAAARGSSGGASIGGGNSSLALGLIYMSPTQDDLNSSISAINSGTSTSIDKLGTAYEFVGYYQYRFMSSMYAIQIRPSYFTQSSSGSGYDFKLTGLTLFPIFRMYALENSFIHFFLQVGMGYGKLDGKMTGPNLGMDWSGDAYGTMAGLGAEFAFTASQSVVIEGNVRYLSIARSVVKSSNGIIPGFSQVGNNQELEANAADVATSMSGIQGSLIYQFNF